MTALALSVVLIPFLASFVVRRVARPERARTIASIALGASALLACAMLLNIAARHIDAPLPVLGGLLAVGGTSAVLTALGSALGAGVAIAAPRAGVDGRSTGDLLLVVAFTLLGFLAQHPALFLFAWVGTLGPFGMHARRTRDRVLGRAFGFLMITSALPMGVVLAIVAWAPAPFVEDHRGALSLGLLVATAARAGLFPLHVWVAPVLERGRLAVALPLVVSPFGSFGAVHVLVSLLPKRAAHDARFLVVWGTVSACYGALLAVGRNNVRRKLAFLWVSAVGTVFAGIGTFDARAIGGALFYEVTATIAITGLLLIAGGIDARTGTADLRRLGGLVRDAPALTTAYLLLSLAVISFPGTAGFVSEHLMIQALHVANPAAEIALLSATALNGITLVRSMKRMFLGPVPADLRPIDAALPRERWVLGALILALFLGGVAPSPLLRAREAVLFGLVIGEGEPTGGAPPKE